MERVSGVVSSNLMLTDPTSLSMTVGLQTNDINLTGIDHTVTVMAQSPSQQCTQHNFTVNLISCQSNSILMDEDYKELITTAKGPTVSAQVPEASLSLSPHSNLDCGEFQYEVIWPTTGIA